MTCFQHLAGCVLVPSLLSEPTRLPRASGLGFRFQGVHAVFSDVEQRVDSILSQMTLGEKLSYIGGTGFFDVKPIPVPNLQVRFTRDE